MSKSTAERLRDWKQEGILIDDHASLVQNIQLILDKSDGSPDDSLGTKLYKYLCLCSENFEHWFYLSPYYSAFIDDFETWIPLIIFNPIFEDSLETDWFTDTTFNFVFNEAFQDGGW